MTRPHALFAPSFLGFAAFALALVGGTAHAAPGDAPPVADADATAAAPAPNEPTPNEPTPNEPTSKAPAAVSVAGSKVAGSQVEGEASVSTEGGFSASGAGDGLQGTFGVGAIRTLGGLTGINARYFVLDQLAIGVNVGMGTWTFRENDPATTDPACPDPDCQLENTRTIATLGLGVEGIYFVKLGNPAGQLPLRADFGLGGRFTYLQGINATDVPDNHDDPTEFDIEIPMVVQLRFGDHFTLSPEFGLNFIIVPGSREEGDINPGTGKPDFVIGPTLAGGPHSGPGFGFQITNGIGVFGGASLHYYF